MVAERLSRVKFKVFRLKNPLLAMPLSLWKNRSLIRILTIRELAGRFAGSLLGRFWLVLSPLIMLGIYAFFFGEILQAKWSIGASTQGLTDFALIIFSGLILHQLFADGISRAPDLIVSNPNYVRKIVFPLEILPVVALASAMLQMLISAIILIAVFAFTGGSFSWSWFLLPVIFAPFFIVTLGLMWLLSSLGVFLRDLRQVTQFVATAALFLSPIFYPMDRLPESLQILKFINPLVIAIEQSRVVLFEGTTPDWYVLSIYSVASFIVASLGFYFFTRSKPAFADVI